MAIYLSLFLHVAMNRETVKCYVPKIWKFLARFKALALPRPLELPVRLLFPPANNVVCAALRLASAAEFCRVSGSELCHISTLRCLPHWVCLLQRCTRCSTFLRPLVSWYYHTYRLRRAPSCVNLWLYRLQKTKCGKLIIWVGSLERKELIKIKIVII